MHLPKLISFYISPRRILEHAEILWIRSLINHGDEAQLKPDGALNEKHEGCFRSRFNHTCTKRSLGTTLFIYT